MDRSSVRRVSRLHLLQYEVEGLTLELRVNDVPVDHVRDPAPSASGRQINMWLRPGKNVVRVRSPIPPESMPASVSLTMKVLAGVEGEKTEEVPPLAALTWPPDGAAPRGTLDVTLPFEVLEAPPTKLWQAAAPLTLDNGERAEIHALVGKLHDALARRNIDDVTALLAWKTADLAASVYTPEDEARAEQRGFFADLMGDSDWKAVPPPEPLTIVGCGDGRVAWVSRQGEPAIVIDLGDSDFAIPLYVAKIDGRMTIVR